MAKRLNKKVALIGSLILLVFGVIFLVILLKVVGPRYFADPEQYLVDAEAAWNSQDYKKAESNYKKAYGASETKEQRIAILHKLADVYVATEQWPNVFGAWRKAISIDPSDMRSQVAQLQCLYVIADNGSSGMWQEVKDRAGQLISEAEKQGLLNDEVNKWESYQLPGVEIEEQTLGSFAYLRRGRANLELGKSAAVADRDQAFADAVKDIEKAKSFEPANVSVYWFLSRTELEKGKLLASRGNVQAKKEGFNTAEKILQECVEAAPNKARAHINVLVNKYEWAMDEGARDDILALEDGYRQLAQKFPDSAEAQSAVASFYSAPHLDPNSIITAVEFARKAVELAPEDFDKALSLANLLFRKYSLLNDEADLKLAIETAKKARDLPAVREQKGPLQVVSQRKRLLLAEFLATAYLEKILEQEADLSEARKTDLIAKAEEQLHEIEQVFGNQEEPRVVKWQGVIALAKGNRDEAIRKMYSAYEQYKASQRPDAHLCYLLARVFKDEPEIGARTEFLATALSNGISGVRSQATLDYAEILMELKAWTLAVSNISAYEDFFGPNERSRRLKVKAYIGAAQFDDAAQMLESLDQSAPATIDLKLELVEARIHKLRTSLAQKKLRQQGGTVLEMNSQSQDVKAPIQAMEESLAEFRAEQAALVKRLLAAAPERVAESSAADACKAIINSGKLAEAGKLVDDYIKNVGDDQTMLLYREILKEPDPASVTAKREMQLKEKVLQNISDPLRRTVRLGVFYYGAGELDEAEAQFSRALGISGSISGGSGRENRELKKTAAQYLFEMAVAETPPNMALAEKVVGVVKAENLDRCEGNFYAARLLKEKKDYPAAMTRMDKALKLRPVFAMGYMLRSTINGEMGNDRAALDDAAKASDLNPMNATIARNVAAIRYQDYRDRRENATQDDRMKVKNSLEKAIRLNPRDSRLLSFYAAFIGEEEPLKAIAILQDLQRAKPTIENAMVLGRLATETASEESDPDRKESLYGIAEQAFKEGLEINPFHEGLLYQFSQHYRSRGLGDRAEELLEGTENAQLLWRHYYEVGQYGEARRLLLAMQEQEPDNVKVVEGLLAVAEKMKDLEAVKTHSQRLRELESTPRTALAQLETYLRVGLIDEAETLLESFNEKYPDEREVLLLQAWLAMRKGDLDRALELTNRDLEQDEEDAAAWRLRGEIHTYKANYEQAIMDLRRSKAESPKAETRIALAKAYMRAGRNTDAITELKSTLSQPGAPMEARSILEELYMRLGRNRDLNDFYRSTLEQYPDSVHWLNRAAAFALKSGAVEEAATMFKRAYDLKVNAYENAGIDIKNAAFDMEFGRALDGFLQTLNITAGSAGPQLNTDNLSKVATVASGFVDTPLAPLAYFRMAEAKFKLGQKEQATELCHKAVETAGENDALTSEILLRMFLLLGKDELVAYCQKRLETDPDSLAIHYALFNLAKINGDYDEALKWVKGCIRLASDDSETIKFTIRKAQVLTQAFAQTSDKQYLRQAISDYKSLLEKMPNNTTVLNNLAYMLAENDEDIESAVEYAKKALEAQPNNAGFLDTYAYALHKAGDNVKAAQYIEAARQAYQQGSLDAPAEVYQHLGSIREALGQKKLAVDAYEQALSTGQLSEAAQERISAAVERLKK